MCESDSYSVLCIRVSWVAQAVTQSLCLPEYFHSSFFCIDLYLRSSEFWFAPSITSCRPCRDAIAVRFVPPSVAGARADEVEVGSWREGAVSRDLGFGLWESEAGENRR